MLTSACVVNIKRKLCQLIKTLQKFACMLAISQLLELRDQRKINSKERNLYLRIGFLILCATPIRNFTFIN